MAEAETPPPNRDKVDAIQNLIQGKRHLLVQDVSSAVSSLQEACRLFAQIYGDLAPEVADPYYQYGSALLLMSRQEASILNKKDPEENSEEEEEEDKDDEEEEEEEKAEVENEGEEPEEEEDSDAKSEDLEDSEKGDENPAEVTAVDKPTDKPDSTNAEPSTNKPESSTAPGEADAAEPGPSTSKQTEEEEDEPSTVQLAWETLELSKLIYERQIATSPSKELKLKLADVYSRLAEVSLESENYQQGIDDFQKCLKIQQQILPEDDRLIAETYYQLGLAYSYASRYDDSVRHHMEAIRVIEAKIASLRRIVDSTPLTEGDVASREAAYNAKTEMEELQALVPDIKEKIVDTEDLRRNDATLRLPEELDKDLIPDQIQQPPDPTSPQKPVQNITHLVRKKRKSGEPEGQPPTKRLNMDAALPPPTGSHNHANTSGEPDSTNGPTEESKPSMSRDQQNSSEAESIHINGSADPSVKSIEETNRQINEVDTTSG